MKTRQTILVLLGILLVGAVALWWYLGFSFDFSRFFAAAPTVTITTSIPATLTGVPLGTISGTAAVVAGGSGAGVTVVNKVHMVIRRNPGVLGACTAQSEDWNGTAWVKGCEEAGQITPSITPGATVTWSVSNTPPLSQMTAAPYRVFVAAFQSDGAWSGYEMRDFTFIAGTAARTACESIGLFNTMADCRATCVTNAGECFQKATPVGTCFRVPNGVSCQTACDAYGPPNCTKMDPDDNPLRDGCQNATVAWQGTYDIPVGATTFQTATYHDPIAGCTKTTTEAGLGGSVVWNQAEGTYTAKWDPSIAAKCGRFQFDVSVFGPNGRIDGAGVGLVFNTGVDCTTPVTHLACDVNRACVITQGAGTNECTTSADCAAGSTISIAVTSACIPAEGTLAGTVTWTPALPYNDNQFRVSDPIGPIVQFATDAAFTQNVGGKYTAVGATSTDLSGMMPPGYRFLPSTRYFVQAVRNGGSGPERTSVAQFTAPAACAGAATHLECVSNACATVTGAGANTGGCTAVGQSCGTVATHLECVSNACATVTGAGANTGGCTAVGQSCGTVAALTCSPATQAALLNQAAAFEAHGGLAPFTWTAVGATPPSGSGASFSASYPLVGAKTVTVTDSRSLTASCAVTVSATPTHLACSGNACVTTAGAGANTCTTSADCAVAVSHLECNNDACVRVTGAGTNECAPEGSFCGTVTTPRLSIEKLVRNVTQSTTDRTSVTANPGDTVEFSLRVFSTGTGTVNSVSVRDALPAGLTYIPGSTTIDNVRASDGIITSRLNLGSMAAGSTIIVRFSARVSPASFFSTGTTVLTNVGFARGSNAPEVSDVAFVTVLNTPPSLSITLSKLGRNVTRGELGEGAVVRSSPAQTIQFIMRVRNTSAATLTNVLVRDVLPPVITLIPGSVTVDGIAAANSLTAAGLSIGNLAPGQEVTIMFSGLVAPAVRFPAGTTIVLNTVTVTATGVPVLSAQLPIIITNGTVVIPPIETGPGETTVLALIVSAIITLLYVGYTSTETFRRHEAGAIAKESRGESSDFK